ncbi:MAG: hypothetical protein PUB89_01575 [Oscillospiraceae bacterium]|uniref:hypothetical protein n=1 Tax=Ruminococcus flavefaciens TaxID=1265 RepID=UPI0026E92078|nr:hypothetical protein [Ruminococcus flavefaciens]MDD6081517.1 hypothetical protein [Oscillospiraceae bacterium]
MEEEKSDYVGTEKKVVEVGCFPCQVEYSQKVEKGNNGLEKRSVCKLYFPSDLPVKIGDGFCITGNVPQYMLVSVTEYADHCVGEAELWK